MNLQKAHPVFLHVLFWIIYGSFVFITNAIVKPNAKLVNFIFYLLPFILSFYLSVYFLNKFKAKHLTWNLFAFFGVFILLATPGYLYMYLILPKAGITVFSSRELRYFFQNAILGYLQFYSYALIYFYVNESFRKERKLRQINQEKSDAEQLRIQKELEIAILRQKELNDQAEKLQLEHAFLRAQINPHFLHNTLNVLFSQAFDFSPKLADNILKLSRIMRYSMESLEYDKGCVSIEKELEQLKTLLEIHQLRFGEEQIVSYTVSGRLEGQILPPLSIITVVENAFKYGDLTDERYPLEIHVDLKPSEIYFSCHNKKNPHSLLVSSNSIGMTNLRKRLDAVFKDKYKMEISDEYNFYNFELTVYQN